MALFRQALPLSSFLSILSLHPSHAQDIPNLIPQHELPKLHELDRAIHLFDGPLELAAAHPEFQWLEGPLWWDGNGDDYKDSKDNTNDDDGSEGSVRGFLLFSDVMWREHPLEMGGPACGMLWKFSLNHAGENKLTKFLKCSGIIGPGYSSTSSTPSNPSTRPIPPLNYAQMVEGGSNGLTWGWNGMHHGDLLLCQHGMRRIVRFNISSVNEATLSIDPSNVSVVVDSYNGQPLNSPNDLLLHENQLYFSDPPFGLQLYRTDNGTWIPENERIGYAMENVMRLPPSVYVVDGDPHNPHDRENASKNPVDPIRILDFGQGKSSASSTSSTSSSSSNASVSSESNASKATVPTEAASTASTASTSTTSTASTTPGPWQFPNGIVPLPNNGGLFVTVSDFADPHVEVFPTTADNTTWDGRNSIRLETPYRIENEEQHNNSKLSKLPALTDGATYCAHLNVVFAAGPGGVYVYNVNDVHDMLGKETNNGKEKNKKDTSGSSNGSNGSNGSYPHLPLLGFLRINDLVSNVEVGGGYLWITANRRLLRIRLKKMRVEELMEEMENTEGLETMEESMNDSLNDSSELKEEL